MLAESSEAIVLKNETVDASIVQKAKGDLARVKSAEQVIFIEKTNFMLISELIINTKGEGDLQVHLCDYSNGTEISTLQKEIIIALSHEASHGKIKFNQIKFEKLFSDILEDLLLEENEKTITIEPTSLVLQKDASGKLKCLNTEVSEVDMKVFTLLSKVVSAKGVTLEAAFDTQETPAPALEKVKQNSAHDKYQFSSQKHANNVSSKDYLTQKSLTPDPIIEFLTKVSKSHELVPFEGTNLVLRMEKNNIVMCYNTKAENAFDAAKRAIEDLGGVLKFIKGTYDKPLPVLELNLGAELEDAILPVLYEGSSIILSGANLILVPGAETGEVHCYDVIKRDPNYHKFAGAAKKMNLLLESYTPEQERSNSDIDNYFPDMAEDIPSAPEAELIGKNNMDEVD